MAQPFSPEIATNLIGLNPGRTATEIVEDALARGIISSKAKDRIASQGGGLVKMFLEKRLPNVRRDETRRPYKYYPTWNYVVVATEGNQPVNKSPLPNPAPQATTFRPTPEQDQILTALVSVGASSNRTEAIHWLLNQGIAARRGVIQQALETHKQIERLRKGVKFPTPEHQGWAHLTAEQFLKGYADSDAVYDQLSAG